MHIAHASVLEMVFLQVATEKHLDDALSRLAGLPLDSLSDEDLLAAVRSMADEPALRPLIGVE